MNFKHYFPTFRTRWLFLRSALDEIGHVGRTLHIGCGEGDHDGLLKQHTEELVACDLNAGDVEHARAVNQHLTGIEYRVEDATALSLPDAHFDAVVCMEVIEHVGDPHRLLTEIARVLVPGGKAILTCPSERFPLTYDPLNFALALFHTHVPLGAYGYGHNWLVQEDTLDQWLNDANLIRIRQQHLTGWLAGAAECYWLGLAQRAMKANAGNSKETNGHGVRPTSDQEPPGVSLVDAFVAIDAALQHKRRSVGLGYVLART